jgi:GT2 family glycosyltransferase
MNNIPKFSVITTTYNRANLLGRSISSLLDQDNQDFELVIVDDGSTDQTQSILRQYSSPRFQVIGFTHNQGIGAARRAGVERACGKWIAFLDADDLWLSEKLAWDMAVLERHPEVEILFDNYRNINHMENSSRDGFDQNKLAFARLRTKEIEPGVFEIESGLAEAMLTNNLIGTASIVTIRRDVFEGVGNFNPLLSGPEDFELLWRAALAGSRFAYQTRVLVERHKDTGSITARTRTFAPRMLQAYDLCEESLIRYERPELLKSLNHSRLRVWQSLIHACALEGRRGAAWHAFLHSLRYGLSRDAVLYFLSALAGPRMIALAASTRKA